MTPGALRTPTEPLYTIGLLSGCGTGRSIGPCLEKIIRYFRKYHSRMLFLLPLASSEHGILAAHLLSLRERYPETGILLALTDRQWEAHAQTDRESRYDGIIRNADSREIVPECSRTFDHDALCRFLIERCDYVICSLHRIGEKKHRAFLNLTRELQVPLPIQEGYGDPSASLAGLYPVDRRDYRIFETRHYDPAKEFRQSLLHLRTNGFRIRSDRIPQIFLRQWLALPPAGAYRYLEAPDLISEVMRLRDTPRQDYLALKVFMLVYWLRHDAWADLRRMPTGDVALRRFRQFRRLLELIVRSRENGARIETFDLFDTEAYDRVLSELETDSGTSHAAALQNAPE